MNPPDGCVDDVDVMAAEWRVYHHQRLLAQQNRAVASALRSSVVRMDVVRVDKGLGAVVGHCAALHHRVIAVLGVVLVLDLDFVQCVVYRLARRFSIVSGLRRDGRTRTEF